MAIWFYSVKGKAEGPVSDEFLMDGLKAGRLTLLDLVYQVGTENWVTLGEVPQFRKIFQLPPRPDAQNMGNRDNEASSTWVILVQKENGFEQKGPFGVDQIMEKLGSGELLYSQFAWRPGYKRWVRIGNLPEFDRRKKSRDGDQVNLIVPLPNGDVPIPALNREDIMENVMRLERTDEMSPPTRSELAPEETDGVDLAQNPQYLNDVIGSRGLAVASSKTGVSAGLPNSSSSALSLQPTERHSLPPSGSSELGLAGANDGVVIQTSSSPQRSIGARLKQIGVTTFLGFALVLGALMVYDSWQARKQKSSKRVESRSPQGASVEVAQDLKTLKLIPPGRGEAQILEILPLRAQGGSPILVLQTDAPAGAEIRLTVSARVGEILSVPSYWRSVTVKRSAGEVATIELGRLPVGQYHARAVVGQVSEEQSFFVGERNAEFQQKLEEHRKQVSYQQQAERKALFYSAQKFGQLAQQLSLIYLQHGQSPEKWRVAYSDWETQVLGVQKDLKPEAILESGIETNEFTRVSGVSEIAYPSEYQALGEAVSKLTQQAANLNDAVEQKRMIASQNQMSVEQEFKKLQEQFAQLSSAP